MNVVGIDEVGRGCWAGPLLVVAARARKELPEGLADSKLLTKAKRNGLFESIKATCDIGEGWVQSKEIDELGLVEAMRLGVLRALKMLGVSDDAPIIMDGLINYCADEFTQVSTIAKADQLHQIVSAASIYAKVIRDEFMTNLSKRYPLYGFEKHVGYGTAFHLSKLRAHGVTDAHRVSFKPIKAFL